MLWSKQFEISPDLILFSILFCWMLFQKSYDGLQRPAKTLILNIVEQPKSKTKKLIAVFH